MTPHIRECRVCSSSQLELVLDLGLQPWANHFLRSDEVGTEPRYPLRLVHCRACATAQLDYTVPKETMFGNHTYLSGVTRSLDEHFRTVAEEVHARFLGRRPGHSVLDIGSNDGTQLKHFKALGHQVLGIESSWRTTEIARAQGIETLNEFFNLAVAKRLGRVFDVVNASGVFFHLEELHSVTDGIREVLRRDGVFVVQFLYMKRIVDNTAFDQIYHEHLLYYTLRTVEVLLQEHGLTMFDAFVSPIHGGSVIGFVGHKGERDTTPRLEHLRRLENVSGSNELLVYQRFAKRVAQVRDGNLRLLSSRKSLGCRMFGLGAPVKGNTLLNYFGIGTDYLNCLVELNPLRRGLFSPGMHIPVVLEDELAGPPDLYYVLAWNFKAEILQRNRDLLDRGIEFIFPVDPAPLEACG